MNELAVFDNPEFGKIRSLMIEDAPWFVGKDVATALGYSRTADALTDHVDDEDRRLLKVGETPTLNIPNRGIYIINESGVYALIFSSKLPKARKFKRWVTSEVLPALRKTGEYKLNEAPIAEPEPPETRQRALTPDDYLKAAQIVSNCRNERLPYVLDFLGQSGVSIPQIEAVSTARLRDVSTHLRGQLPPGDPADIPVAVELLQKAREVYKMPWAEVTNISGVDRIQGSFYVHGQRVPSAARASDIVRRLTTAFAEIDEEAIAE